MATPQTKHPGRRLLTIFLLLALGYGALVAGSVTGRASLTPGLALDLEGGTQIILTPTTSDGSEITDQDVDQAIEIIRQRVDASGVAEAQISRQGGQNIVVSLPGTPSQETLELVRTSAVLYFRPVIRILRGSASAIAQARNQAAAKAAASASPEASAEPSAEPTTPAPDAEPTESTEPAEPAGEPTTPAAEPTTPAPTAPVTVTPEQVATSWRTSTRTARSPPTPCRPPARTTPRTPGSPSR